MLVGWSVGAFAATALAVPLGPSASDLPSRSPSTAIVAIDGTRDLDRPDELVVFEPNGAERIRVSLGSTDGYHTTSKLSTHGNLAVLDETTGLLQVIDTESGSVVTVLEAAPNSRMYAVDGSTDVVAIGRANVDPAPTLVNIDTGAVIAASLLPDGLEMLWTYAHADPAGRRVAIRNRDSNTALVSFENPAEPVQVGGLVFAISDTTIYTLSSGGSSGDPSLNTIELLDERYAVIDSFDAPWGSFVLGADDSLYGLVYPTGEIIRIDPASPDPVTLGRVTATRTYLALSEPDRVVIESQTDAEHALTVLDGASGEILAEIDDASLWDGAPPQAEPRCGVFTSFDPAGSGLVDYQSGTYQRVAAMPPDMERRSADGCIVAFVDLMTGDHFVQQPGRRIDLPKGAKVRAVSADGSTIITWTDDDRTHFDVVTLADPATPLATITVAGSTIRFL